MEPRPALIFHSLPSLLSFFPCFGACHACPSTYRYLTTATAIHQHLCHGPRHRFSIMSACNRAPVETNRSPQTHIHSQRSASFQCSIHFLLQVPTPSTASRGSFMT
ncbi:uncharacterized protein F5891DRAFT_1053403 [Suillus fuscotomentosus]|uniref:Secreted protein n=1 Tax=Suillus fuscotomentosus TaxID=1912939 RepID=A0AAD4HHP6_9AGAM|nr:uncharacterized protein F5891DRAFT_1053403 [Suillus fuscotomentosus]KAG1896591.1 hypothetical protein F5891DRAFT_1053403 [Suillus fuscotomentosus]